MKLKHFWPIKILKITPPLNFNVKDFIRTWQQSGVLITNYSSGESTITYIKPKFKKYRIGTPDRDRIETQLQKKRIK